VGEVCEGFAMDLGFPIGQLLHECLQWLDVASALLHVLIRLLHRNDK